MNIIVYLLSRTVGIEPQGSLSPEAMEKHIYLHNTIKITVIK